MARVRGFLSARAGVCGGLCMHGGAGAVHPRAGGRGGCASIHTHGRACTPTYVRAARLLLYFTLCPVLPTTAPPEFRVGKALKMPRITPLSWCRWPDR